MPRYLITLRPLEPYFFGGERTFGFGKKGGQIQKYYIKSERVPSQTTLFGTLRYIILKQEKALLGEDKAGRSAELVGAESFSFEKALSNKQQAFGIITHISPLFLTYADKREVEWLVPTPYNHKHCDKDSSKEKYIPYKMTPLPIESGDDFTIFPADYHAKTGYYGGYTALSDLHIVSDNDIFLTDTRTGINAHRTENTSNGIENDGSFFKKERKMLKEGFSFAFIADIAENHGLQCETGIVFMGQDKSPFSYEIQETGDNLTKHVQDAFQKADIQKHFLYALSDIMPVNGDLFPQNVHMSYYMADTKMMRNLETNLMVKDYYSRLTKQKLYKLMRAGAVFFTDIDFCDNAALRSIGLNTIIKL